jgi:N-acetyl-alpha-D-glucosaminyl L-malate synthase BshA
MKIGIVCYPTYGGSGVMATELGVALAKRGHEIHFITYKRPARLANFQEKVYYHEVDAEDYPLFEYSPYDTTMASKLVNVVLYENLDILHVHYAIPHAAIAYMAKKILLTKGRYIPVVTTLHGTDITLVGKNKDFAPVVEFSINKSDGVTAVSNSLREQTMKSFNIEKDIEVIYNFVDFTRFKKTSKEHFKKAIAPNGEKILTHISNFREVKRVEDVIRVFDQVHQILPSKLLLIGDGPDRRKAESLCRELGLMDEIRFLGKQDAVEEILAVSDVFLIPSANESFGLAALEAMACEVPVISSDVGGLPEVNIHGKTGYLSPIGSIEDMAKNTLKIIGNDQTLAQFRQRALEQAKRFALDLILPQYEEYYEHVLKSSVYTTGGAI